LIISRKLGHRGFPIGVSLSFEFHERLEADAPTARARSHIEAEIRYDKRHLRVRT
jgi:hypothetical protein